MKTYKLTKQQKETLENMGIDCSQYSYCRNGDVLSMLRIFKINLLQRRGVPLNKIAKNFHISRQRIDQLLRQGNQYNIISYPSKYNVKLGIGDRYTEGYIKSLAGYFSTISEIADQLGINTDQCQNVVRFHNIECKQVYNDRQKEELKSLYVALCNRLGRRISSTEIQLKNNFKLLRTRILNTYKNWSDFIKEIDTLDIVPKSKGYFTDIMKATGKHKKIENIFKLLKKIKNSDYKIKKYFIIQDVAKLYPHSKTPTIWHKLHNIEKMGYIGHARIGIINKYYIVNKGIQKCKKELNAITVWENKLKSIYRN